MTDTIPPPDLIEVYADQLRESDLVWNGVRLLGVGHVSPDSGRIRVHYGSHDGDVGRVLLSPDYVLTVQRTDSPHERAIRIVAAQSDADDPQWVRELRYRRAWAGITLNARTHTPKDMPVHGPTDRLDDGL